MIPQIVKELHNSLITIDMHSHFLTNGYWLNRRFDKRGEPPRFWNPLRNFYDLQRAREGGVKGITFTMFANKTPRMRGYMEAYGASLGRFREILQECAGEVAFCVSAAEVRRAASEKRLALLLAAEGAHHLDDDLDNLTKLRDSGCRMLTLLHFASTSVGDSSFGKQKHGGLTEFGKRLVIEMQKTGIIVDTAHASEKTFFDVIKLAQSPIVSSHTAMRHFKPGDERALSDDQLYAIRDTGGVAGVIFFPWYLKPRKVFCDLSLVVDHIAYIADKIGVEYAAIGTDMDAPIWLPRGFRDARDFTLITYELYKRGFRRDEIAAIMGENYLRILAATDDAFKANFNG